MKELYVILHMVVMMLCLIDNIHFKKLLWLMLKLK